MAQFDQVSVVKQATLYFDGLVSSRTVHLADGKRITLGIMQLGEFEFATDCKELMEIQAGELDLLLPGGTWTSIAAGDSFEVEAGVTFKVRVHSVVDYCCHYS